MRSPEHLPLPIGGEGRGEGANPKHDTLVGKLKNIMILVALFLSAAIFTMPFAIGFPSHVGNFDITALLLAIPLICGAGVVSFAAMQAHYAKFRTLYVFASLALVSLIASQLLRLDIQFPVFEIPTPHILAPLLNADGESAYDADVLEIYFELWLITAIVSGLLYLGAKCLLSSRSCPLTLTLSPTSWWRGNGSR